MEIAGTAQREAWLRREMPPVEQLDGDLWSVPVPIPDNPLRYVSSYAFGAGEGLVLIDAGWGSEEAWQSLLAGLESIGAGIADVRGVLVTHLHFDHIGLAGPEYGGQMRIFAVTETAAHLDLLEHRGLVTASSTHPVVYTATGS